MMMNGTPDHTEKHMENIHRSESLDPQDEILTVRSFIPGRIRIRSPLLRHVNTAIWIESVLSEDVNIFRVTVHRITGSVLIRYDATKLDGMKVYHSVRDQLKTIPQNDIFHSSETMTINELPDDRIPTEFTGSGQGIQRKKSGNFHSDGRPSIALESASLATSVVCDFVTSAVMPLSAAFLTVLCVPNFRNAFEEMKMRKVGPGTLHLTILVATVASGSFFAAALMGWFIRFWENKLRREQAEYHRFILSQKSDIQKIFIMNGIRNPDHIVVFIRILDNIFTVSRKRRLAHHGKNAAEWAVLPTLITSCGGFLIGDLTMMLAILRPDYATGPGIAGVRGFLRYFRSMLNSGIVMLDTRLCEGVATADLLIIEPERDWLKEDKIHQFRRVIQKIRWMNPDIYIVISGTFTTDEIDYIIPLVGADSTIRIYTGETDFPVLRTRRKIRVVCIGNTRWNFHGNLKSATRIGTGWNDIHSDDVHRYSAILLRSDPELIADMWMISHRQYHLRKKIYRMIYVPNFCCVVGAFFGGFTSLTAVVITNLASWNVFRISRTWNARIIHTKNDPEIPLPGNAIRNHRFRLPEIMDLKQKRLDVHHE